ncbi:MAG: adenylate/guanylate cyclase domain-containing protein [Saonia sp.]
MSNTDPYRQGYQYLIETGIILLLFIGGANLFIFIKTTGVEKLNFSFDPSREINTLTAYVRVSMGGFLIGILTLIHEKYFHPKMTQNFSFFKKRLIWQVDSAFIIILPIFIVFTIAEMVENEIVFMEAIQNSLQFLASGLFISFFIYYYSLSIIVSFLRRLRKTFGQHVFYNYIIGKYAQPLEERRTFLFLDLNDSTSLAETLGHVKYSRLLNRCFEDIIFSIKDFKFDIYQFVGDEVVLTWLASHSDNGRAINIFQEIKQGFENHRNFYISKFGLLPTFKAAISTGTVTATLVGGKSKNIAYHGDVLNTTARLLGLCKRYNKEILFTEFYVHASGLRNHMKIELIATLKLKGKANESKVYSVRSTHKNQPIFSHVPI